jgi:hypothetical protein
MGLFQEVKCGRCDKRYSSIRSRCPYCGARKNRDGKKPTNNGNSNWKLILGIVVLLAIIIAVIVLISNSLKNQEPYTSATLPPEQTNNEGVDSVEPSSSPTPTPTPTPEPTPTPTPEPVVNSIVLNRTDFTLSKINETFNLEATLSPAGTQAVITWVSEDPSVATVSPTGLVTAVNKGHTNIIAAAGGVTAECIVRVSATAAGTSSGTNTSSSGGISLSHKDVTINSATKESFKLSVSGAPSDAVISYSSSDTKAATVDSSGKVTAVATGTATITVKIGDTTLTCIVRVK